MQNETVENNSLYSLQTREDVASLLGISLEKLNYYTKEASYWQKYKIFQIQKKNGSFRRITAPRYELKKLQDKLKSKLELIYSNSSPKTTNSYSSVHGFIKGKSIKTNAECHLKQNYVVNLDLQKFFPSINFGRVRGLFIAAPYHLGPKAATAIAQLCCHNNELPQGAPTSPIIANMICAKMDYQIRKLASQNHCKYTRYADDITISTRKNRPQKDLFFIKHNLLELGEKLKNIITENGFEINPAKTRFASKNSRQEVTGLTVNEKLNISRKYILQIRAMIHALQKHGEASAEKHFNDKWDRKDRCTKQPVCFRKVLLGKLEFIRSVKGENDLVYIKYRNRFAKLCPDVVTPKSLTAIQTRNEVTLYMEGPTDVIHLQNALSNSHKKGKHTHLHIYFDQQRSCSGDTPLLDLCKTIASDSHKKPQIFVFDHDNPKIYNKLSNSHNPQHNVFAFSLPKPPHITDEHYSIEFFYTRKIIKQKDQHGRCLFVSDEFDKKTHRHKIDTTLNYAGTIHPNKICIIDKNVFNEKNKNVALSKTEFAENIANGKNNFETIDTSAFDMIFDKILELVKK